MRDVYERLAQARRVGCPFCFEWIPAPARVTAVHSADGALGGRCPCGAAFVVDETGRSGGQAMLDAQVLLCDGDLDRALTLETGVQVDIETRDWLGEGNSLGVRRGGRSPAGPKVWFVKRRPDHG